MRVFLAGATGAIGAPLLARLTDAGHEVIALTRSAQRAEALRRPGVESVVADALDAAALHAAVVRAQPEVVINQLTALPKAMNIRRYREELEPTNRLRREAGPVLARAAADAGARRLIAQSVAFMLEPAGPAVLTEDAPLMSDPPKATSDAVASMRVLERATLETPGVEGIVLRYGFFYGPGTTYAPGSPGVRDIARRRFPVLGDGAGMFSFVHVDDAADATVRALDHGAPGIYNITDDEPVRQGDWVPAMAAAMAAPPPRRVPVWVGRLAAGPMASAMSELRGASNAKARTELGWAPSYPSYREGFPAVFAA